MNEEKLNMECLTHEEHDILCDLPLEGDALFREIFCCKFNNGKHIEGVKVMDGKEIITHLEEYGE